MTGAYRLRPLAARALVLLSLLARRAGSDVVIDSTLTGNIDPSGSTLVRTALFLCPFVSAAGDPLGRNSPALGAQWGIVCKKGFYDNGLARSYYTGDTTRQSPSVNCSPSAATFPPGTYRTFSTCTAAPVGSSQVAWGTLVAGSGTELDTTCGLGAAVASRTCYCALSLVTFQRPNACAACPAGFYGDADGARTSACTAPCPAGTYGGTASLTTAACSGQCTAGYYVRRAAGGDKGVRAHERHS
jgi:hypothetical protein